MPAKVQGVLLHVDALATSVHLAAPHEISKHGQSNLACHLHNELTDPVAFPAYCRLHENHNAPKPTHFIWSFVLFVVFFCPLLFAADKERNIHQFGHTAWGAKEGCPSGISALAQTKDGYLWLGTRSGLYRFDGVSFEKYEPSSPFRSQSVNSLLARDNGDLWIGFRYGTISLLHDGRIKNYGTQEGVPDGTVFRFAQDGEGTIWAATGGGLARLEGVRWKEVGEDWDYPGKAAEALVVDRHGTLWVATENTVVFLPPRARKFRTTDIHVGQIRDFSLAADGKLWMAETSRSVRPMPSHNSQPPSDTEIQVGSVAILFDDDDALWVTSLGDGLRRDPSPAKLHSRIGRFSNAVESFTTKDGLSGDDVRAILQDREGTIWVGTMNGLDRFRKTNIVPFPLAINPQQSVFTTGGPGEIWIDSDGPLIRIRALHAHTERVETGSRSGYRDPAGVIWWISERAIYRFKNGRYSRVGLPEEITRSFSTAIRITQDPSGVLWVVMDREGLFYLKEGSWKRLPLSPELARLTPTTAFTDWRGHVWFCYIGGKFITFDPEKIDTPVSAQESPVGTVRAMQGANQHLWIGGELGLALFDGHNFRAILPADAKTFENVNGVVELSDNSLWLSDARGIIHVPSSEVRKALDDPPYRVRYELFDSLDGLPGPVLSGPSDAGPAEGVKTRLWFLTINGMAWLNPAEISTNPVPPPVSIKSLGADGRQYTSWTDLKLPPRIENLQIGYTALSLAIPERVRFHYKLEGIDKDWQDAGARREAFYTRLGPGKYTFRVIACNNDGVWNAQGATLDFSIAPAWYQTGWFRSSCVALSLLLLWALYHLRLLQVEKQFNIGLEARVNERTRIARELHDTLLQSFQGLLLRFQAVSNLLPGRPDEAKRRLDGAIDQAAQAITEGRDAVHELRACTGPAGDLDAAIRALGEQLIADHRGENSPTFRLQVEGTPRELQPILRDEVYRIAGEALRNAFRHAEARRIEAEIRYDENRLRLRVRDDGKGIDPKLLNQDEQPGHWGLPGMRERAKLIGGRLDVWSELEAGTEVELSVPASLAYRTSQSPRRRWISSWLGKAIARREKG